MKIALIGYGKMGQEIHRLTLESKRMEVALIIDPQDERANYLRLSEADFADIDVAIDFTHPSCILENIRMYCDRKMNVVIGTTGWHDRMGEVRQWVEDAGIGLLWASNFSIGVHLFWKMVEHAGTIMNHFPEYDVFGHEFHHNQKADAPSGTARSTAELLTKAIDRKTEIVTEELNRKIEPHELHFSSTRGGNIPGTHSVFFDSPADTIELKHTARNRSGFASGALRCAEWLQGKRGFFSIEDYLKTIEI